MRGAMPAARLNELVRRYDLPDVAAQRLLRLLELVETEPASITAVRDPGLAVEIHVADSLVALDLEAVRRAAHVADLGSGNGFPGLALAIALPAVRVSLVESIERKCRFLRSVAHELELGNVEVVQQRAESWAAGLGVCDVVTARALAALPVVVEYAAPLLAERGTLVAWKGRLEPTEAADGAAAARMLGLTAPERVVVEPFPSARERGLYVSTKVSALPAGYPRRPGMARKRPLGRATAMSDVRHRTLDVRPASPLA